MIDVTKPTVVANQPSKSFNIMDYIKEKIKKEPRLVWISGEDHIINGAHILTIGNNSNWAETASISTDGLQPLSNNPQAQMAIMDVRFQQVLDALFGKGNVA
jgi:hypothetical protein